MPENVINPCMWESGMMNNFVKSMIMKFGLRLSNFLKCQWHRNIYVYILWYYILIWRVSLTQSQDHILCRKEGHWFLRDLTHTWNVPFMLRVAVVPRVLPSSSPFSCSMSISFASWNNHLKSFRFCSDKLGGSY